MRRKFTDNASDKFKEVLRLINLVYHPPKQPASPESKTELLDDAEVPPAAGSVAASAATIESLLSTTRVDTATFDLKFEVSDCDESDDFDTSSDLFV